MNIHIDGDVTIIYEQSDVDSKPKSSKTIRTRPSVNTWKKKIKNTEQVCQCCGKDGDGHLEVHHIFPLHKFKQLASEEGNGITLCQKCHSRYHEVYNGSENANTFSKFMRDEGRVI